MIPMKTIPGFTNNTPGIQVGTKFEGKITLDENDKIHLEEEGVNFLKQIGVEWVMIQDEQVPKHDAKTYKAIKEAVEATGLKVYRIENRRLHNIPEITLGLQGRDELIEQYCQYIRDCGEAGVHYTTYAYMANGIWRDYDRRPIRGNATGGGLDFSRPHYTSWFGEWNSDMKYTHGREFSEEELWENYRYFISKVAPVAEESGVYIGIHPDDPPVYNICGIPRCIFGTFKGYKKAIEIANSPNIGVCLCIGCWLEGGKLMGVSPVEAIKYFAEKKKLFKLHVRNVTNPLYAEGGFNETFPDAGYYNLADIIQALDDVDYDGAIMNDHLIDMVGGHYTCEAYFTSYLKGLVSGIQNHRNEKHDIQI